MVMEAEPQGEGPNGSSLPHGAKLTAQEVLCWPVKTRQAIPPELKEAVESYEGEGKPFPFFYRTKNGHHFVVLRQISQERWTEFVKALLEREPTPGVILEAP